MIRAIGFKRLSSPLPSDITDNTDVETLSTSSSVNSLSLTSSEEDFTFFRQHPDDCRDENYECLDGFMKDLFHSFHIIHIDLIRFFGSKSY